MQILFKAALGCGFDCRIAAVQESWQRRRMPDAWKIESLSVPTIPQRSPAQERGQPAALSPAGSARKFFAASMPDRKTEMLQRRESSIFVPRCVQRRKDNMHKISPEKLDYISPIRNAVPLVPGPKKAGRATLFQNRSKILKHKRQWRRLKLSKGPETHPNGRHPWPGAAGQAAVSQQNTPVHANHCLRTAHGEGENNGVCKTGCRHH